MTIFHGLTSRDATLGLLRFLLSGAATDKVADRNADGDHDGEIEDMSGGHRILTGFGAKIELGLVVDVEDIIHAFSEAIEIVLQAALVAQDGKDGAKDQQP